MLTEIQGLHHVTSLASSASANNAFFTHTLGLRRVKKTVNFDAPDVYHLYYGDALGTPGTAITYFPFPNAKRGRHGTGEVATTAFSVPAGSLDAWQDRLATAGVTDLNRTESFGEPRVLFSGPDGEGLSLVARDDPREPWTAELPDDMAIRGFHSVDMRLADTAPTAELLKMMGYEVVDSEGETTRFERPGGNAANVIEITRSDSAPADQGAGSVHHIAFAVTDKSAQATVQQALRDQGFQVTPQIDRDYFWAIYFRSPGGVLFEVATNEPGFDRDEDRDHLGEALKLPSQHAHLRDALEQRLEPID